MMSVSVVRWRELCSFVFPPIRLSAFLVYLNFPTLDTSWALTVSALFLSVHHYSFRFLHPLTSMNYALFTVVFGSVLVLFPIWLRNSIVPLIFCQLIRLLDIYFKVRLFKNCYFLFISVLFSNRFPLMITELFFQLHHLVLRCLSRKM